MKVLGLIFIFTVLALSQEFRPWRQERRAGKQSLLQFLNHFGLIAIGNFLVKTISVIGLNAFIVKTIFGNDFQGPLFLIHNSVIKSLISLLILDYLIYWQHRWSHQLNFLWKFHYVHHTDRQMELSSAIRFHPIEIGLSFFYKSIIIFVLGISYQDFVIFESILLFMALFNHSNINLPQWVERIFGSLLVTPRMHFVHHSIEPTQMNKNFGFSINLWDRLHGTYLKLNEKELIELKLGVKNSEQIDNLKQLLLAPFRMQK